MIEPKIDEIFSLHGIKVKTYSKRDDEDCSDCAFAHLKCKDINCYSISREDLTRVIFKEVEQTKIKPMEVKIQIPDNCELIKDGDTYVVKEKKQGPPRSWKEFCDKYPVREGEAYIDTYGGICTYKNGQNRCLGVHRNNCTSEEEAKAFLALMQLRQLRKAWVGDWKHTKENKIAGIFYNIHEDKFTTSSGNFWTNVILSFPSTDMAKDFLNCFRDLCEKAKPLL